MDNPPTIQQLRNSFPTCEVASNGSRFRIDAHHPEGMIEIDVEPDRFTVYAGEWHGHFDSPTRKPIDTAPARYVQPKWRGRPRHAP